MHLGAEHKDALPKTREPTGTSARRQVIGRGERFVGLGGDDLGAVLVGQDPYLLKANARLGFRNPVNVNVRPPEGAPALESVKIVNYDLVWATDNMDRIRKKRSSETGK